MQRINTHNGLFAGGNPATNTKGTVVTAEWLNTQQEEIISVISAAGIQLTPANNGQLLDAIEVLIANSAPPPADPAIRYLPAGTVLPTTNIGPIWHDDYGGIMSWQVFTANGANYIGYASIDIGRLALDTQQTVRPGYIKSGTANLSRTAYAALRAWAMHNGRMVAVGAWTAGSVVCADNADGTTFRIYDVRGDFLRCWDDGGGVDPGRAFGSLQTSQNAAHAHGVNDPGHSHTEHTTTGPGRGINGSLGAYWEASLYAATSVNGTGISIASSGGTESRPINTALLPCVKY
ncbi:MAG: hypothetical protein LBD10_14835 [Desulfobulbus sp.]|jgi:hypothetical protein|uniref:hypothetical protein n=1 Tax=Desulfobulbus sp. TaxID=895 RepID=UPI0028476BCA|nr:hypothetical protein [Desulfobulbus sp.]MDR2551464.1 hypothetical protein [Desulfobulbus sp.]